MISKSAQRAFLGRKLNSFDWVKDCSEDELDKALDNLNPKPFFYTPPYKLQKACFLIGLECPEFLYFLDLGLGKTKLMLDLIRYRKLCGEKPRAIALVPNLANIEGWVMEVEQHAPDLFVTPLVGDSNERFEQLDEKGDLFIINYQGMNALVTDIVRGKDDDKGKWKINKKRLLDLSSEFNSIIFDESTEFKNHLALTYRVCRNFSTPYVMRISLTGTPFGRNPEDLWSQFYVVDRGLTLGPTLGLFREAFFTKKKSYWGGPYSYDYTFDKKKEKKLHQVIKNRSIFYDESECPDLPEKVFIKRTVSFPIDTFQYYKKVLEQIRAAGGNKRLLKNSYIQMRQLASGFLGYHDDDEGKKAKIVFDDNPKLDEVMSLVKKLPNKKKMIIFHEYTFTGEVITRELDKLGAGYDWLWSGTEDQRKTLRRFREDPACTFLVCNNKSGAFGLNLQVANYVVIIETPDSVIRRRQIIKRAHRPGQKELRVFFFDIMMQNSVDYKIHRYLKEGRELVDAVLKGKEKFRSET